MCNMDVYIIILSVRLYAATCLICLVATHPLSRLPQCLHNQADLSGGVVVAGGTEADLAEAVGEAG